uniref:Uncharacterized protein n=1 Tax=Zea mays TaxID=4577 RepID=A0A804R0B1_MAIZE
MTRYNASLCSSRPSPLPSSQHPRTLTRSASACHHHHHLACCSPMAPASSPVAGSSTRSVASATSSGYDALSPSDPASRRRGHNQAWPGRDNQVQPSQRPRRSEGVRGWGDASAHSRLPPRGGSGAETGGEGGRPRGVGIWEGSGQEWPSRS